jgi:tyrosinase
VSPTVPAAPAAAPARLRHRRSARRLTAGQAADLRSAVAAAQAIRDDRGYQHHAGIHGLPLPMSCTHGSPLFLPWHRAYLFFFEKALQHRVAGVTLPWWDWTHDHAEGIPRLYARARVDGKANPLRASPIQRSGREPGGTDHTVRDPDGPGAPPLPTRQQLDDVLALGDFLDFSNQLEDIHNGVHVWVGGTMADIATAAYDPLFWAHHAMIDRVWRLWQLRHPHAGPPASLLRRALPPFPATVADVLDSNALGYDYAAATAAAPGPGHG